MAGSSSNKAGGSRTRVEHQLRARAAVRELRRRGQSYLVELADDLGYHRDTLQTTMEMLHEVVEMAPDQADKHKRLRLRLRPEIGVLVGAEVSNQSVTLAASMFDLSEPLVLPPIELPMANPGIALNRIADGVLKLLEEWRTRHPAVTNLVGVGLTLPGPIRRDSNHDSRKQAARWNRHPEGGTVLANWDVVDPGAVLANLLKKGGECPPRHEVRRFVWLENDASAGALGVHSYMRATATPDQPPPDDLIFVRLTWGIGAGIVNKGHLVTGAHGFAGELGHIIVNPSGALCSICGRRGCLETVAADRAVEQQLREVMQMHRRLAGEHGEEDSPFEALLRAEHPAVDRALRDAGRHVGTALAQICAMLDPQCVVLGGDQPATESLFDPGALPFVQGCEEALKANASPEVRDRVSVSSWSQIAPEAKLSPQLLGSLALVVDHLGDGYLLDPIQTWMSNQHRSGAVEFSKPTEPIAT